MTTGPRIKRAVTVETKRTTVYAITADDIRKRFRLPDDAEIVVRVPGGGDWSNTDLAIKDHPLTARFTKTTAPTDDDSEIETRIK
jgi:hypothetical protein